MQRSANSKQEQKKKINLWKWLCIVLVAFIAGTTLFIAKQVTMQSPGQKEVKQAVQRNQSDHTSIGVTMNKKQLNGTINYYLKQQQKDQQIKYRFYVGDAAILMGTTKILGQSVSFSLYTEPTVTDNGNIRLRAKSVAIGSLSAPPSFILNYVKNNYKLGNGITINSKEKTITLNLSELTNKQRITVKAQKIDLKKDDFRFKVDVPLEQ
ncbi:YpmS family protein [Liquorilactobacillus capillatus]|uniref:Extracellular protein n=1 Tax=Liquorilactobacillus capillatus DSM 19910 TaxID=1423731 RepID=A0A0R1M024_9LACO|nr:YpmS family protein [Liquorilactobacillus capillatus]KRL01214.1 hypothetical protein FC81_GL001355 [Liquorilactobacillus capillatus DSM 19910]